MKYSVVDTKTGETLRTFTNLKDAHNYEDKMIKEFGRPTFGINFVKNPKGRNKRNKLKRTA